MATQQPPPVVLFASATSPVSRRVVWYLTLREVPYYLCLVDNKMPRPVLSRLGLQYRRLPVLAIGRDIYCDSRNIIEALEDHYPILRLGADPASQPYEHAVEKVDTLLERGSEWLEDRQQLMGRKFTKEALDSIRPDVLATARVYLNTVQTILKDGRDYISGSDPSLADVHLSWAFNWMLNMEDGAFKDAYPELLDEEKYPDVFRWISKLNVLVDEEKRERPIETLSEDQTIDLLETASLFEPGTLNMIEWDPTGFEKGTKVDLYTTDVPSGIQNKDTGELIGLTDDNVTMGGKTKNGVDVRIHYPRLNVKIARSS